jgi:DNA-binding protein Fis
MDRIEEYFLTVNRGKIYDRIIADIEKLIIEKALERAFGNQIQAAKLLGINRNTIHTKIKKLNIDVERFK